MTDLRRPPAGRRPRALALFAGALASAILAGCTAASSAGEVIPGVRVGVTLPAPEDRIAAPLDLEVNVVGGDGRTMSLGELRGQVVVVNFWASWCAPCRAEQPDLNEARLRLEEEPVTFIGVNIDDTEPNALAHEREFAVAYPSLFDPDVSFAARFGSVGPRSIPTTILLDAEGRVAIRLFGITDTLEVTLAAKRLAQEVITVP
ncbi:MAG: thiol-disulfide isomerase/thioredoxin [Nitriliruptoraceae bacterium]